MIASLGALSMFVGLAAQPAQAAQAVAPTNTTMSVQAPVAATVPVQKTLPASATATTSYPSDMSGVRFTYRTICVHTNVDIGNFPVDWAAQQFNLRSSGILKLTYSSNCVAAGYSETQFFSVIARWAPSDWHCITTPSTNQSQNWGSLYHWSDHHPSVYINVGNPDVCGGLYHLDYGAHFASEAVGVMLGLKLVCGYGWRARVMDWCDEEAKAGVPWATTMEGNRIAEIYQDVYGS
jgi:hypothetical protein